MIMLGLGGFGLFSFFLLLFLISFYLVGGRGGGRTRKGMKNEIGGGENIC